MKKVLFLMAVMAAGVFLTQCSSSEHNELTFTNDMETIYAWSDNHPSNIVYFNNAHSGKYVCLIDSTNIFGVTFNMKNKQVDPSQLKKVTIGAWFNAQQKDSDPFLAIDIRDADGNSIDWISSSVKDNLKSTGEWTWSEMTIDLTPKNRNGLENTCRIYAFNKSGSTCLVDDMKISYEK